MIGKLVDVLWSLWMIKAIILAWFVEIPALKYGAQWVQHADENPILQMTRDLVTRDVSQLSFRCC